jgi:hypothetical protein
MLTRSARLQGSVLVAIGVGLSAGALWGCAAPRQTGPVSIAAAPEPARDAGKAWQEIVREHSRRVEVYDWAVRQADLRATLVTPRLRRAFLLAREGFQGKFSQETARDLVALGSADEGVDAAMRPGPEAEQQILVFVAMYVTDRANRDIAASYTIWETRLVRGSASVAPLAMDTIRNTPAVMDVFPYVDRFDDLYLLRFPLTDLEGRSFMTPGGEPLRLEVKSALAEAVVEWTLAE